MDRRKFLLALPGLTAAPAYVSGEGKPPVRACIAAGEGLAQPDICGVMADLGLSYEVVSVKNGEAANPIQYSLLWITCEEYPYHLQFSQPMLSAIDAFLKAGKGVFAEFVVNFPGVPAAPTPQKTGVARLFVREPLDSSGLPAGSILDEHDSICLPIEPQVPNTRAVLSFGEVKGVRTVIGEPSPGLCWAGLITGTRDGGRFAVAGTSISAFRRREYAPATHWERFLRELVLALLPDGDRKVILSQYLPVRCYTEPRRWVPPGSKYTVVVETEPGVRVALAGNGEARKTSGGRYEKELQSGTAGTRLIAGTVSRSNMRRGIEVRVDVLDRREAYRRALERNLRWFERSGVLLRADGTLGVCEWISGPDINGNRIPYGKGQMFSPLRTDCVFQSGLAFWLAGKVQARPDRQKVGENLLAAVLDLQRLGRDDAQYGLWYTRGRSGPPYLDDVAWGTMGCLAGHRYTGRPVLQHRGTLSAAASLKAFQAGGNNGLAVAGSEDDPYPHPHDQGTMLSSWLYAYGATGERTYLEAALPLIDRMIEKFPSIPIFLISRTEESVRFLLPLTLAYAYTQSSSYRSELRKQATYIASRIASCGAIQEEGSNAGKKQSGDLSLTYDANETISDQLYTMSFAAMNLWIAYKADHDEEYRHAFERVADYLTRIQVADASRRAIDGGWMRGFDYGLWEYYGSNADQSWTTYCMETGWCNAIIDIALALYLLDDGFYAPRRPLGGL